MLNYRFSVNGQSVSPIYKDDLAKEYTLESQQRFYRASLSGKLTFIRDDYEFLKAQPFETEFVLLIEINTGAGWSDYWVGKFFKTNGNWDEDDKKVEVKLDVKDQYNDVMAGLEKEYNLIKLAPEKSPLEIQKRPLIQIYNPGDSVVSCFLGGNYWEQDVTFEEENTSILINTYYFALASTIAKGLVTGTGTPNDTTGEYSLEGDIGPLVNFDLFHINGLYRLSRIRTGPNTPQGMPYRYLLTRLIDDVVLFRSSERFNLPEPSLETNITLNAFDASASGTLTIFVSEVEIYARYLLDVEDILGTPTNLLPVDDIVADNRNYKRAIGYALDVVTSSQQTQVEPTEYGLSDNGGYFVEPYFFGERFYPIARSTWGFSSHWFNFAVFDNILEEAGRKAYVFKETSPLSSAISVLLEQFAPGITHEGSDIYSEFLYGATNPVAGQAFRLMLTQKTNILYGEFDTPAQKAPITLSAITRMLKDTFKAYWYIENNKFKIEHISWFKNGGSYAGAPEYTADLTTLLEPRNRKPWGFNTSKYDFDKAAMPERLDFKWMDDVTPGFEGTPIVINSKFVQEGKIDQINIANFTTDIDYMILNPQELNPEGFALFASIDNPILDKSSAGNEFEVILDHLTGVTSADVLYVTTEFIAVEGNTRYNLTHMNRLCWYDINQAYIEGHSFFGGGYGAISPSNARFLRASVLQAYWPTMAILSVVRKLPFNTLEVEGADLVLQNGLLSWPYLQPRYWVDDLPAQDVTINDSPGFVSGIMRGKKQKAKYPSIEDPNPIKLVKTQLGDGEIEKLSVNLSSRMNTLTLKYDTE